MLGERFYVRIACGVVVALAVAVAWTFGPAEQGYFDSAFYVDGARHLVHGDGYVSAYLDAGGPWEFQPITHWAPGTSLLMAPWIALGAQPLTAAAIVLGACYVGAVLVVFVLGVSLAGARAWPVSLLAAGVFALSPSTLVWLDAVLSDLPWASFALLSVWLASRVMSSPEPGLGSRIGLGLALGWLVLMRYAGLLFLPGLLAGVLLGMRAPGPLWKRPLRLWPVLLTAATIIGLWNLRNKLLANKPLGGWNFVDSDIHGHFDRAGGAAVIWVVEALQEATRLGVEAPVRWLLAAAAVSLVPLLAFSVRDRWRELVLVVLCATGYFAAIVFAASVTVIAKLSETRFWIVIWPLTWLAVVILASARGRPRVVLPLQLVVAGALACVFGLYASRAYRAAPTARQPRVLLHPAWAKAAEVLPGPGQCSLFVNDPRPFMLHRELTPTRAISLSMAEFEAELSRSSGKICIATTERSKRLQLSTTAERRRKPQTEVVEALQAAQRLKLITRRAGVTLFELQ